MHRWLCFDSTNIFVQCFSSFESLFYGWKMNSPSLQWFSRFTTPLTSIKHFQCAEWFVLFRFPHIGFLYVFWNRSLEVLRWNILFGCGGSCMGRKPWGPFTQSAPLLMSRPRCDPHHFSLPALHFPTNIVMPSWWPPPPYSIQSQRKAIGQSPFKEFFFDLCFSK